MPVVDFPRAPDSPPCWVRLRTERPDGFVEFDFAIADPDLSVELILPRAAYEEFCVVNRVHFLSVSQGEQLDAEQATWRRGHHGVGD